MAFECLGGVRYHRAQMLGGGSDPFVQLGHVGEEPLRAPFHDGEQHAVLGAVVVVDGAEGDAGLLDHPRDGGGVEALARHDALRGVEDTLA